MKTPAEKGFGWQRDLPDSRDYTLETYAVQQLIEQLRTNSDGKLPARVDLREFFPAAYDQLHLPSSTSQACVGLVEYFERRCHGNLLSCSRLFHYQTTRALLGDANSTDLRTALKALVRFGVPPERYWPYDPHQIENEPGALLFSFADSCRNMLYVRIDERNSSGRKTLYRLKAVLAANIPVAFGFAVPSSISRDGVILYRPRFDCPVGGQAVVAVGYNDDHLSATRGAILIRNSWGPEWGEQGYAWLPYDFILEQLAADFWTILRADWIDSGELLRPILVEAPSAPVASTERPL